MKKIIILSILLLISPYTHSMQKDEKAITLILFGAFASAVIYDFFIKDTNIKLAEKYSSEQRSAERMIEIGVAVQENRIDELKQLHVYLNQLPNKSNEQVDLQKYISEQVKN